MRNAYSIEGKPHIEISQLSVPASIPRTFTRYSGMKLNNTTRKATSRTDSTTQIQMFRGPSVPSTARREVRGGAFEPGWTGGSRINQSISNASTNPGAADRLKALRQPKDFANKVSTSGHRVLPSRFAPKFCAAPMARPRRCGSTSAATNVWLMGMTPPSAMPIINRAAISIANEDASPDSNEAPENTKAQATRMALRLPSASERRPTNSPASAQLSDSAEPSSPI